MNTKQKIKKHIQKTIEYLSGYKIRRTSPGVFFLLNNELRKQNRLAHYWYSQEMALRTIFDSFDVNLVLDVGANKGQYASFLRNYLGYKGKIISFEPVLDVYHELNNAALNDPNWERE